MSPSLQERLCCLAHWLRTTRLSPRVTPQNIRPLAVLTHPWPAACTLLRQINVRTVRFVPLIVDGDDTVKEDLIESWWRCKGRLSFLLCWHVSFNGCHGNASLFFVAGADITSVKRDTGYGGRCTTSGRVPFSLTRYNLNTLQTFLPFSLRHFRIKVCVLFWKFTVFFLISHRLFKASAVSWWQFQTKWLCQHLINELIV